MKTEIYLLIFASGFISLSITLFAQYIQDRRFNKYFIIISEESYDLDNLFPIRITGTIIPKMDYLEIPYGEIKIEIKTATIIGQIKGTGINLSFIRLKDRKKAIRLVKKHYVKAVNSYVVETNKNKAEYINLINLSKKQLPKIEKLACSTCKNTIKCEIAFTNCNYERDNVDKLLAKGIKIDMISTPVLQKYGQ